LAFTHRLAAPEGLNLWAAGAIYRAALPALRRKKTRLEFVRLGASLRFSPHLPSCLMQSQKQIP